MKPLDRLMASADGSIVSSRRQSATFSRPVGAALLVFSLLSGRAYCAFHLWQINELYSNADGSVQFIELRDASAFGGQQFIGGHTITVSGPSGTHTFTCPTNLPSDSFGKTFIIGTSNLSSIPGGVLPNFVFTNSGPFLFLGGGVTNTVNWAGFDIVTYTNLPTDGSASLVRSGGSMASSATNSPKNFNNQSNSIVPVKIQSISQSGSDFILSFATAKGPNGTAGPNYGVESSDTINAAIWPPLANVGGDGTVKTVTNSSPPDLQRFYRLRVP